METYAHIKSNVEYIRVWTVPRKFIMSIKYLLTKNENYHEELMGKYLKVIICFIIQHNRHT